MQRYLLKVLMYWIKEVGVDGWRLDVADEIPHSFWKKARQAVKSIKKDVILIGEVWYDSSSWLNGDEFDTVMNYQFYTATLDFIAKNIISAKQYGEVISRYFAKYKKQTHKLLWNLIDSHDTARFKFLADENLKRQKLAALLQFMLLGTPVIYYGDEVGLSGANDPDNRRGMLWGDRQDKDILSFYKRIIKIRKQEKSLVHGNLEFLDSNKNILHIARKYNDETIEVFVNNTDKEVECNYTKKFLDVFYETEVSGKFIVPPLGFKILKVVS